MLPLSLHTIAIVLIPGSLRIGALRVPVFGLIAAGGLVVAMAASQPCARRAGVSPQDAWDAGVFAVAAGFVVSRLLLVVSDPVSFVHYPLLVLSLPSLTYLGMAVAAVATLIYLRRRQAPLLCLLDAWAVPGALLAAVLELAHFVEGTGAGMPSGLPWAMRSVGDSVLGPVQPVPLYGVVLSLALAAALWAWLGRAHRAGSIAGFGMLVGGMASFGLDLLRQPLETFGDSWLEPSQWIALGAAWIGGVLLLWAPASFQTTASASRLQDPQPELVPPLQEAR